MLLKAFLQFGERSGLSGFSNIAKSIFLQVKLSLPYRNKSSTPWDARSNPRCGGHVEKHGALGVGL
jgi:hypothetical protein